MGGDNEAGLFCHEKLHSQYAGFSIASGRVTDQTGIFPPMKETTTLRIAIGDYLHTLPLKRGAITSPWLKLDFVEVKPMHKAFRPMVRELAFDASEMALVTYFQAKD